MWVSRRRVPSRTVDRILHAKQAPAVAQAFQLDEVESCARPPGEQSLSCCRKNSRSRSSHGGRDTLLEVAAWASQKSLQRKDAPEGPPPELIRAIAHGGSSKEKRDQRIRAVQSTTPTRTLGPPANADIGQSQGGQARAYAGHVRSNGEPQRAGAEHRAADPGHRHRLLEREAAVEMVDDIPGPKQVTSGCRQELRRRSDGVQSSCGNGRPAARPRWTSQNQERRRSVAIPTAGPTAKPGLPDQPETRGRRCNGVSDGRQTVGTAAAEAAASGHSEGSASAGSYTHLRLPPKKVAQGRIRNLFRTMLGKLLKRVATNGRQA